MKIKSVVFDMDGTLLNSQKKLPPDFAELMAQMKKLDITPVIATGRHNASVQRVLGEFYQDVMAVTDNGSAIYSHGNLLYDMSLDRTDAKHMIDKLLTLPYSMYCSNVMGGYFLKSINPDHLKDMHQYVPTYKLIDNFDEMPAVFKISLYDPSCKFDYYDDIKNMVFSYVKVVRSGLEWIDIMDQEISKGDSLVKLFSRLGIAKDEVLVFGDAMNDYEMAQYFKYSVAMQNADPLLKKASRYITLSNDDNGISHFLSPILANGGILDE